MKFSSSLPILAYHILSSITSTHAANGINSLTNGGFENPIDPLANWDKSGGFPIWSIDTVNPYEGKNAATLPTDGTSVGMETYFDISQSKNRFSLPDN